MILTARFLETRSDELFARACKHGDQNAFCLLTLANHPFTIERIERWVPNHRQALIIEDRVCDNAWEEIVSGTVEYTPRLHFKPWITPRIERVAMGVRKGGCALTSRPFNRKKPSGEFLKEKGMLHLSPEERDAISLVIMDGKLPSQIANTQRELLRIRGLIKSGLHKIQDWLLSEEHSTN
jgi:hypothetical protein